MNPTINTKPIYFLRYIAALLIVVYHFGGKIGNLHLYLYHGYESVNFFFFLSGFIMAFTYKIELEKTGKINAKKYWTKRFARIYPVYFLSFLLLVSFFIFSKTPLGNGFAKRAFLELALLQSWVLKTSINYPGWSISVEMFFYLTFPFIFPLVMKLKNKLLFMLVIAIYVINLIAGFYLCNIDPKMTYEYSPYLHIGTFLSGIIFYKIFTYFYQTYLLTIKIKLLLFLFSFAFLSIFIFVPLINHNNGWLIPFYWIFLFAFLIPSTTGTFLSQPFFILLGNISYTVYIMQLPLKYIYDYFLEKIGSENHVFNLISFILFLNLVCYFIYKFFEKPVEKYIRKKFITN